MFQVYRGALGTLAMIVGLGGCAATEVATASPGQDIAGKQFNPAPAGLGAVYFYYPATVGPAINVGVGPQMVSQLGPMTWARVELGPGWHVLRCRGPNGGGSFSMPVSPGDMRFVEVQEPVGAPACGIQETPPGPGRAGVMAGTRAAQ
ncbi:hypothetical protein [Reyranella sp.]|uniref:hypothetical protein n=1 Tax=Reyranella sp. TaxID=1929291 RepID=UPI003BACB6BD